MCFTEVQMYVYPNGYPETIHSPPVLCLASIGGQPCSRHCYVTLTPKRVPFPNQVPQAFRNPASGYSAPFMMQFPPAPSYNPHMYPPSPPQNPHMYPPSPPQNPHFPASGPRHSTDEKPNTAHRPAKDDTQPRRSTSHRPTAKEERTHRRRDKARIVIDVGLADDSSSDEQTAEERRPRPADHCDHCNHHSHSDDDKVPHRRRSQRHEPEQPNPPPTPCSSPPPCHSGPSNEAKAARCHDEIRELRETVRRLEKEAREKMREEREWDAQRRRSKERSSRPRRRTTAGGCDCNHHSDDFGWC
ncbi:hypothetical protein E4U16_005097 [Claviceps sp. LM84 group G4]|nr:hypothetical protein E4U33_000357 [Claviceps sp. LM78 group G4]KAG6072822.1 hypothetical protein E4U16_005097 [Claviceps sp. LM84 group G4]